MKIVKAKFIGLNGSLGLCTGSWYILAILKNTITVFEDIKDKPVVNYCPYGSVNSFLSNWDQIETVYILP